MTPGAGTGTERLVTESPEARSPERRSAGGAPGPFVGSGALGLGVSVVGFTLIPEARRPDSRSGWDGVVSCFSSAALGGPDISTAGFTLSPEASRPESLSEGATEAFVDSAGAVLGASPEAGMTLRPEARSPDRRSGEGATAVEGSAAGLDFGGRVEGEDLLPVTES